MRWYGGSSCNHILHRKDVKVLTGGSNFAGAGLDSWPSSPSPQISLMTLLRRFLSTAAAAIRSTVSLHRVSLSSISPAADSLFQISLDVSPSPSLISSYTRPGQYLQLRLPHINRSTLLAIASPPSLAESNGVFEFLVKSVRGSTAEMLCELKEGDVVELSHAIGDGFEMEEIRRCQTVLIFATGSGIR